MLRVQVSHHTKRPFPTCIRRTCNQDWYAHAPCTHLIIGLCFKSAVKHGVGGHVACCGALRAHLTMWTTTCSSFQIQREGCLPSRHPKFHSCGNEQRSHARTCSRYSATSFRPWSTAQNPGVRPRLSGNSGSHWHASTRYLVT